MILIHHLQLLFGRLDEDERGASLVEYALLIALIALVCIAAVTFLGEQVQEPYSEVSSAL